MTSLSLTGKDGKYSIADEWINAIAFVYTGSILAHGFQVLNGFHHVCYPKQNKTIIILR